VVPHWTGQEPCNRVFQQCPAAFCPLVAATTFVSVEPGWGWGCGKTAATWSFVGGLYCCLAHYLMCLGLFKCLPAVICVADMWHLASDGSPSVGACPTCELLTGVSSGCRETRRNWSSYPRTKTDDWSYRIVSVVFNQFIMCFQLKACRYSLPHLCTHYCLHGVGLNTSGESSSPTPANRCLFDCTPPGPPDRHMAPSSACCCCWCVVGSASSSPCCGVLPNPIRHSREPVELGAVTSARPPNQPGEYRSCTWCCCASEAGVVPGSDGLPDGCSSEAACCCCCCCCCWW
jgi:hypothetical protein